ncbi:MAG: hypothetical protein NZM00_14350 [Anaerolinea sp.]|nr:hypothetical protein [Anaerolinea sp.]
MHIHSTQHVMIAGSRYATREMLDYARRAVQRAHAKGYTIFIGDNPRGVELAVVGECRRLKTPVIVAGVGSFPRNGGCRHGSYVKVPRDLYRGAGGAWLDGDTARDRWMVDQAHICLFIWDGSSPGTKAGCDYAVQRGKDAHLINFDRSPVP